MSAYLLPYIGSAHIMFSEFNEIAITHKPLGVVVVILAW